QYMSLADRMSRNPAEMPGWAEITAAFTGCGNLHRHKPCSDKLAMMSRASLSVPGAAVLACLTIAQQSQTKPVAAGQPKPGVALVATPAVPIPASATAFIPPTRDGDTLHMHTH